MAPFFKISAHFFKKFTRMENLMPFTMKVPPSSKYQSQDESRNQIRVQELVKIKVRDLILKALS